MFAATVGVNATRIVISVVHTLFAAILPLNDMLIKGKTSAFQSFLFLFIKKKAVLSIRFKKRSDRKCCFHQIFGSSNSRQHNTKPFLIFTSPLPQHGTGPEYLTSSDRSDLRHNLHRANIS